jgi:hypothetical protein
MHQLAAGRNPGESQQECSSNHTHMLICCTTASLTWEIYREIYGMTMPMSTIR